MKYVFNFDISGVEKIKIEKPLFAVANHQAMWDSFGVLSAMGFVNFMKMYPWRSPITESLHRLPWVWVFAKLIGLYKIEPKGELSKSLGDTIKYSDKGYSIFFFPSGKMVKKDEIADPKKGIGYICQNRDVFLLPVRIIYRSYNSKGRGKIWGAKIIFGDAFCSRDLRINHSFDHLHWAVFDSIQNISEKIK